MGDHLEVGAGDATQGTRWIALGEAIYQIDGLRDLRRRVRDGESVWFPEVDQRCGPLIESGKPFLVTGRVVVEYGVATLEASLARGVT